MPSHNAPALEELQRIQRIIAFNKVDGKLDFDYLWQAAKKRYLSRFTRNKLIEINDALVGVDYYAIDVRKMPAGAKDILDALERSVFETKFSWDASVFGSVAVGAVVVIASFFLAWKTLGPRPQALPEPILRADAKPSASAQPAFKTEGGKVPKALPAAPVRHAGSSSRDEQVATFINLAGYLCGQVRDSYMNPDGTISAHCTETRSGKGRAVYRLDLDAPSVERID